MKVLVRSLVVGFWALGATVAGAQGSPPTQQSIEAKLQAPFLILRGLWHCNSLHFDAQGNLVGSCEAGSFSTSALVVKSIKLTDAKLEITGNRGGLQFERTTSPDSPAQVSATNLEKMKVSIDRDPQHPEEMDAALDRIFAKGFDDELADAAPSWWQPWLRHQAHPNDPSRSLSVAGQPHLVVHATGKAGEVLAPRLLRAPDPSFSDEAKSKKFQGMCIVDLIVDAIGQPHDIRIIQPLGMGLDEKAIQAVSRYQFAPATKDGQPVPVEIRIEVNFRIY